MRDDIIVTSSDIGSIRTYLATRFLREIQVEGKSEEHLVGVAKAYFDQKKDTHSVKQVLDEYGSAEVFSGKIIEDLLKSKSIIYKDGLLHMNIDKLY